MKNSSKINPWLFGMVFLSIFAYLAWNNFEIPRLFLYRTNTTKGCIIDIQIVKGIRGYGYNQKLTYAYTVNGVTYSDIKKIGKKYGIQRIGNKILIKYSEEKPQINNFINFIAAESNQKPEKYIFSKNVGYEEIILENNIFKFTEIAGKGVVLEQKIGEYEFKEDSLILKSYSFDNKTNQSENLMKFIVTIDSLNRTELTEITTRRKFK